MTNLQLINAILYVTENGCKWRALPETYGNWHTIYVRMNRWSKNGVLSRVFAALQTEGIIQINVEVVCLDSTTVKVHPDGTGALKKEGSKRLEDPGADSPRRFISGVINMLLRVCRLLGTSCFIAAQMMDLNIQVKS